MRTPKHQCHLHSSDVYNNVGFEQDFVCPGVYIYIFIYIYIYIYIYILYIYTYIHIYNVYILYMLYIIYIVLQIAAGVW